jgi:UDP-N-acetylmuramoylalanine--D-glutamate ligase
MPGIAIGMLHGILPEVIARAIRQFQPLEHRLEPAGEVGGVRFYNDSIATVSEAAIAAIETLDASPIVLIAGGYDRGLDFTNLARTLLTRNIRALVLFPVTGARILARMEEIDGTIPPRTGVETMREAVEAALSYALPGDTVLLSPASPSFTQFNDYRDRGRQFKAEVRRIAAFTTSQPEHSGSPA